MTAETTNTPRPRWRWKRAKPGHFGTRWFLIPTHCPGFIAAEVEKVGIEAYGRETVWQIRPTGGRPMKAFRLATAKLWAVAHAEGRDADADGLDVQTATPPDLDPEAEAEADARFAAAVAHLDAFEGGTFAERLAQLEDAR